MLLIVLFALIALVLLITVGKINPFLAFLIVSIAAGVALGVPVNTLTKSIEKGMGDTLGSIVIIIALGAMLGKLIAESGAAQAIAAKIMQKVGLKHIQWALVVVGFIVGLPLFYGVGFVLVIPLIFSVVYQYNLPAVYIGLPMLASMSVAHGFLPPHPSPSALVIQFGGNMGVTLGYGILIAIPTIIVAGPLFSRTLKNVQAKPLETFRPNEMRADQLPGASVSFIAALLPVFLFAITSLLPLVIPKESAFSPWVTFFGEPSIVMLIALIFATITLGVQQGKPIQELMTIYTEAVKDVAMILLIIGGAGALKQVLTDSGVSAQIVKTLEHVSLPPLFLGWLIAAIIRVAVGSATVAGFTAAGIIQPLMMQTGTNPNLMVLSIGAGSLMFSHVNDSGFWLFKEFFNTSIKDTIRSWSLMETIVAIAGLIGVLILNLIIEKKSTDMNTSMNTSAEQNFKKLGLTLPPAPAPVGVYKPCLIDGKYLYVSGHGPVQNDKSLMKGRIGRDIDQEQGKLAAQQVGLAILATIKKQIGSLDKVKRVIKVLGMVNCTPEFEKHPYVINGCSELFAKVWGEENGVGVRSAVGFGSLPDNIPVEIEALFELKNDE